MVHVVPRDRGGFTLSCLMERQSLYFWDPVVFYVLTNSSLFLWPPLFLSHAACQSRNYRSPANIFCFIRNEVVRTRESSYQVRASMRSCVWEQAFQQWQNSFWILAGGFPHFRWTNREQENHSEGPWSCYSWGGKYLHRFVCWNTLPQLVVPFGEVGEPLGDGPSWRKWHLGVVSLDPQGFRPYPLHGTGSPRLKPHQFLPCHEAVC